MTRQKSSPKSRKRYRVAIAFAAVSCAAFALVGPRLIADIGADLSLADLSLEAVAVLAATRDSYRLTETFSLPFMPHLQIESGTVSIGTNGPQPETGTAVLAMLQSGKAHLVLDDASMSLDPSRMSSGGGSVAGPSEMLAPLLSALVSSSFSTLEVRGASVHLKTGRGAGEFLENVNAMVTRSRSGRVTASGDLSYRGRQLTFETSVKPMEEVSEQPTAERSLRGWPVEFVLRGELVDITASGILGAGEALQLYASSSNVKVSNVRGAARWLGVGWQDGDGFAEFSAEGPFEWTSRGLAFLDAKFKLDGNDATGALALKFSDNRPAFDGTLAFGRLDLSAYFPKDKAAASIPVQLANFLPSIGAADTAFHILDHFDADLRVSASAVVVPGLKYGKSAASLSIKDGTILADIAELELARGGRCGGQLSIDGKGALPTYVLRGKVQDVDMALVSTALWAYPVVSGQGELTLDLTARGRTADEVIASLSGKASLSVPKSGELGADFKTLAATARAAPQSGWGVGIRARTAIESLTADVSLRDGEVSLDKVVARAGDATFSAVGTFGLADKRADIGVWIAHAPVGADTSKPDAPAAALAAPAEAAVSAASPDKAATANRETNSGGGVLFSGSLVDPEIRFVPGAQPAAQGTAAKAAEASKPSESDTRKMPVADGER